jgi:hypothetical protein
LEHVVIDVSSAAVAWPVVVTEGAATSPLEPEHAATDIMVFFAVVFMAALFIIRLNRVSNCLFFWIVHTQNWHVLSDRSNLWVPPVRPEWSKIMKIQFGLHHWIGLVE